MSVRESWSLEELEADVSQYESFLEEESAFLRARAIDAVSEQENAESLPEAAELRRVAPRNEAASTAPAVERKAEHKASVVQAEGGASGNVSEAELLRLISEERGRWQASLLASSARMAASLGAETPHNQSAMPAARRAPSPLASRPARRPQSAGAARRSRSQEPSPARGRRPSRAVASMLEAERRQLTFRPQLQPFASSRSSEARSSDVYARNREWQVAQDEKLLEKTRVAAEEEKRECSFRPHINPVSEALVELRRGGGAGGGGEEDGAPSRSPVEQRLLEVAQARTHSRELLRRQKEQEYVVESSARLFLSLLRCLTREQRAPRALVCTADQRTKPDVGARFICAKPRTATVQACGRCPQDAARTHAGAAAATAGRRSESHIPTDTQSTLSRACFCAQRSTTWRS